MKRTMLILMGLLLLGSLASFALAAEKEKAEEPAKGEPEQERIEQEAPRIDDRDGMLLDVTPSSWSNVKALWG